MKNDELIRAKWEQRAATYMRNLHGVLLRGLPDNINQAIDRWQAIIIETKLVPYLPDNPYVLDLAAGYGRLSQVIRRFCPNAYLVGTDFSITYCQLYDREAGKAVCADLRQPPFAPKCWDGILLVTGLMYLNPTDGKVAIQQVLSGLKQNGVAMFLDPGGEMMGLLKRIRPSLGATATGGIGFSSKEYLRIFQRPGYKIIASGGNILFTMLLPVCLLLKWLPMVSTVIANRAVNIDLLLGGEGRFALHRWVIVRRED